MQAPVATDTRDAAEHEAVRLAIAVLPQDHTARQAYRRGAGTIELSHLVADRPELVEALTEAFLAGYRRMLRRDGGHFRPEDCPDWVAQQIRAWVSGTLP